MTNKATDKTADINMSNSYELENPQQSQQSGQTSQLDQSEVYWVGSYIPANGLSINVYLINDEYPTLINTGAIINQELVLKKIEKVIDPSLLKYIIIPHAGIAYAGGLSYILEKATAARVVASEYEALKLGFYNLFIQPMIVTDNDTLNIGKTTLRFIDAPFIGASDAMFVYDETHRILFSGDAFSTTVRKWQTQTNKDFSELIEAYYQTHIGDSLLAVSAINNLNNYAIDTIAPGHGPVLKKHIYKYIDILSKPLRKAA